MIGVEQNQERRGNVFFLEGKQALCKGFLKSY